MPKSNSTIAAPLREALFECFCATTRLVRPELRRQLVLVGGAASIAHSSVLATEDVDAAAPPSALIDIWEGVSAGALNFTFEPDGKIAFDAPSQDIRIRIGLLEIGNGYIERIHVAEPSFEVSVASVEDSRWSLLRVASKSSNERSVSLSWITPSFWVKASCKNFFRQFLAYATFLCIDDFAPDLGTIKETSGYQRYARVLTR